jgi:hypothetical protein
MTRAHHPKAVASDGPEDYSPDPPAMDAQRRQAVAGLCVVPRCPRCRTPLVARMTCAGPSFACNCEDHRFG